jgi:hypothetical protein
MKKAVFFILSFLVLACNKADNSRDDIPISGKFIGEINCQKNYKVFTITDPTVIKIENFLPSDTITLDGIKYNNVFFAEIPDEIIKTKSRFDKMMILDSYLVYGFWPLKRGTIDCSKYKKHFEKLRVRSIN